MILAALNIRYRIHSQSRYSVTTQTHRTRPCTPYTNRTVESIFKTSAEARTTNSSSNVQRRQEEAFRHSDRLRDVPGTSAV